MPPTKKPKLEEVVRLIIAQSKSLLHYRDVLQDILLVLIKNVSQCASCNSAPNTVQKLSEQLCDSCCARRCVELKENSDTWIDIDHADSIRKMMEFEKTTMGEAVGPAKTEFMH